MSVVSMSSDHEISSLLTDEDRRELLLRAFDMQFRIMEMMLEVLATPRLVVREL